MKRIMRPFLLLLVSVALSLGCGCLPNPQSEWTSSEGGTQVSTLDDPVITDNSTLPTFDVDTDWDTSTGAWVHHIHTHNAHVGHVAHVSHSHVAHAHAGGGHHR
jgi:hypothetical protein